MTVASAAVAAVGQHQQGEAAARAQCDAVMEQLRVVADGGGGGGDTVHTAATALDGAVRLLGRVGTHDHAEALRVRRLVLWAATCHAAAFTVTGDVASAVSCWADAERRCADCWPPLSAPSTAIQRASAAAHAAAVAAGGSAVEQRRAAGGVAATESFAAAAAHVMGRAVGTGSDGGDDSDGDDGRAVHTPQQLAIAAAALARCHGLTELLAGVTNPAAVATVVFPWALAKDKRFLQEADGATSVAVGVTAGATADATATATPSATVELPGAAAAARA